MQNLDLFSDIKCRGCATSGRLETVFFRVNAEIRGISQGTVAL